MFDKIKKKQQASAEEDGLDILAEVKEPFSMSGFFETHVVERAKQIKDFLANKGILVFLFSPFQARNRLIAQILILCIGVMFGVIPRASSLVSELQDQAYASEIAGLSSKTVGSLSITPAASSNYQKVHMLAFVVEGKNLPSDASKYEVHMARSYGASDWENVTYSWTVVPVTDTKRILLVAVDQSKQASGYGAFSLYIQLAGEEVASYAKTPFEITLSVAQDTTSLYDKNGIHLSALTEAICGKGKIAEKQKEFEDALKTYQVVLEQAQAMPVDITVSPTMDELENYCLASRVYRSLNDLSTTEDILKIEEVGKIPEVSYDVVLTSNGIAYDSEFVDQLKKEGGYSDEDVILFDAFESVENAKKSVTTAMDNVNNAAAAWYSTLSSYKLILNQKIDKDLFPLSARCTNTVEEDINFLEKTAAPEEYEDIVSDEQENVSDGQEDIVPEEDAGLEEDVIQDEPEEQAPDGQDNEAEVSDEPGEPVSDEQDVEASDKQDAENTDSEEPAGELELLPEEVPDDSGETSESMDDGSGSITASAASQDAAANQGTSSDPADTK